MNTLTMTVIEESAPSSANLLLWVVLPYVTAATLVVGLIWRYRYDKFGWTTRSSQLYETRIMRIASPLFHFGALAVIGGHFLGLLIPQSWTDAWGVKEDVYHSLTMPLSLVAGTATIVGMALLIYRRRSNARVFQRTTANDKVMYVFLASAIVLGVSASWFASGLFGEGHNYREDVSVWARSILMFQPQPEHMASAPLIFQLHVVAGLLLFSVWPFTRLVHVLSAPLQYVVRPYVVYRTKTPHSTGSRATRRGWEPSRRD
ncbi:respiratory nitrate reductase subunit gamma [Demequina sp. TTPB684]|uniref:respiratory nitrate reductase subunit gamma n=1 Tax=unclassified Demequina TaxID=2620311 RepID=UPI001CF281CC|nr:MULTISPECIES: respiratory nitrate reductase subunit gamma [unclassified Demequina]MCB2412454.1 respiratory nitrate reductase subunit gamma [Demequina sp. TTPB684]UPU88930.1 respiratory nitrate reductase subunit gamma [Demequina sp. TMPB413]